MKSLVVISKLQTLASTACVAGVACCFGFWALAQQPVALELVLAIDTSVSVDAWEYRLQMQGLADAFRTYKVINLISDMQGGIAVTVVHWSYGSLNQQPVSWQHLHNPASVWHFADLIASTPRGAVGKGTAIGDAIAFSAELISDNDFVGVEAKINISSDARNNSGPAPNFARDIAVAQGITINGLTITDGDPGLHAYFRLNVIGGTGAFALSADHYADFATAMQLKLFRELSTVVAAADPALGKIADF